MARDIINRSIDAGRDVSQRTQDRLEDLVSEFVRQSEEQAEQARALLTDLIGRSRTTSEQVVETVEREVRSQIANLGLATVEDIDKAWTVSTQAPKGPMATMDVIGFRPLALINKRSENPLIRDFADLLEERIAEGKAGLADGEGFYLWNADGEIIGRSDFGVLAPALGN